MELVIDEMERKSRFFCYSCNAVIILLGYGMFLKGTYLSDVVDYAIHPMEVNGEFLRSGRYITYFINSVILQLGINTGVDTALSIIICIVEFYFASLLLPLSFIKYIRKDNIFDFVIYDLAMLSCIVNPLMVEYLEFSAWSYIYGLSLLCASASIYMYSRDNKLGFIGFSIFSILLYQSFAAFILVWTVTIVFLENDVKIDLKTIKKMCCLFLIIGGISAVDILSIKILVRFEIINTSAKSNPNMLDLIKSVFRTLETLLRLGINYNGLTTIWLWPGIFLVIVYGGCFCLIWRKHNIHGVCGLLLMICFLYLGGYLPTFAGGRMARIIAPSASFFSVGFVLLIYLMTLVETCHSDCLKKRYYLPVMILIIAYLCIMIINLWIIEKESRINIAKEEQYAEYIYNFITQYEQNNDQKIKTIVLYKDIQPMQFYPEIRHRLSNINARMTFDDWGCTQLINYLYKTNYQNKIGSEMDEVYLTNFMNYDWSTYCEEQLVFDGDTLYLCRF